MTRVLTYTLTLEEPCLLAAPGGDPNTESSLNYIPGGAVRGALVAAHRRNSNTLGNAFDDLFLSGKVRYLNAYPLLDDCRALPTPRAWTKLKDKGEMVYNRAEEKQFLYADQEIPSGVGAEFVTFAESVKKPKIVFEIAVHTARNRGMGRSIEGDADSALFRYRALARDQQFTGAIVIEDEIDTTRLEELLVGSLLLGGSHFAGYGLAGVSDVGKPENWREVANSPLDIPADGSFVVYLASHAILYHPDTGQPTGDILLFLPDGPGGYEIEHSFAAADWVGGFNKQRGLPLSQQWALQMGSAWVVKTDRPLSVEQIAKLERSGIGARTEEGFGRLVINPQWPQQAFEIGKYSAPPLTKDVPKPPDDKPAPAHPLLAQMNERIARAELDRRLAVKVNELADPDRVRGRLSRSQLGRLQVRIRREAGKDNFNDFLAYLEGTRKRKSADDQLRKYTVDSRNFRVFLEELAGKPSDDKEKKPADDKEKKPETVWDFLDKDVLPSISSEPINVRTKPLTHEYTVKFIANLCRQLSKLEDKS